MSQTLTKSDLVQIIHEAKDCSRITAAKQVDALIDLIKSTLISGEDVLISGFGKFCVKEKDGRTGVRNISTGEELTLPPRRVVTFRCSGKLRQAVNGA